MLAVCQPEKRLRIVENGESDDRLARELMRAELAFGPDFQILEKQAHDDVSAAADRRLSKAISFSVITRSPF